MPGNASGTAQSRRSSQVVQINFSSPAGSGFRQLLHQPSGREGRPISVERIKHSIELPTRFRGKIIEAMAFCSSSGRPDALSNACSISCVIAHASDKAKAIRLDSGRRGLQNSVSDAEAECSTRLYHKSYRVRMQPFERPVASKGSPARIPSESKPTASWCKLEPSS